MTVEQAIGTLSQADPIIKLLQQVKLGRMKPTDAGLQAVTEAWLGTYRQVLQTAELDRQSLLRIDPSPRLAILIETGVLTADHPAVRALRDLFNKRLAEAHPSS
jgi:hypothetical protein